VYTQQAPLAAHRAHEPKLMYLQGSKKLLCVYNIFQLNFYKCSESLSALKWACAQAIGPASSY
jgi:hypothetical protein